MTFELIRVVPKRAFDVFVSIDINGRIYFSRGLCDKYELAQFKSCDIYFDKETEELGVLFHLDKPTPSRLLTRRGLNGHTDRKNPGLYCNVRYLARKKRFAMRRYYHITKSRKSGNLFLVANDFEVENGS